MKKLTSRKLSLHRETLRDLLRFAHGAEASGCICTQCPDTKQRTRCKPGDSCGICDFTTESKANADCDNVLSDKCRSKKIEECFPPPK